MPQRDKQKEVDKFEKDMRDNDSFDYGIFCSLTSGIVNKKENVSLEFVLGKPVIYLTKLKENPNLLYVARLNCLLILKNKDDYNITKEEDQSKLQEIFKKQMKRFNKRRKNIEKQEKRIKEDKKLLEEEINESMEIQKLINVMY